MADVIQFPSDARKAADMERLINQLSDLGLDTSIIRNGHNWCGDLAFTPHGKVHDGAGQVMAELHALFMSDKAFRTWMYEYFWGLGSLYYEASTSTALSFEENPMPRGGAQ